MSASLHLVVGAGPLGSATAEALLNAGKTVRVVTRSGRSDLADRVEIQRADISDPAQAIAASQGATAMYLCGQPAYHRWPQDWPPMLAGTIAAAQAHGARFVLGDNLYMYGYVDGPIREGLPYTSVGSKPALRGRIARTLLDLHAAGQIEAVIGRGSDFYGPRVRDSEMGERTFAPALAGKAVQLLGNPDLPHTQTYIGDFGRVLASLGTAAPALMGRAWHVPNAEPTITPRQFVDRIGAALGRPVKVSVPPKVAVWALGRINPSVREVMEMYFQFEHPYVVDDSAYRAAFPDFVPTPIDTAIAAAIAWYRAQPDVHGQAA